MPDGAMELSREDAWRIYELLEVMNDFLHQPANYQTGEDVSKWLGTGVYKELHDLYYNVVARWFPVSESGHVPTPEGVRRRFPE